MNGAAQGEEEHGMSEDARGRYALDDSMPPLRNQRKPGPSMEKFANGWGNRGWALRGRLGALLPRAETARLPRLRGEDLLRFAVTLRDACRAEGDLCA